MDDAQHQRISVHVDEDGTLVVAGDIDLAIGPLLESAITEREREGRAVCIDLRDVTFMDSSGLRTLLAAVRRAEDRRLRVTLRSVGPEVTRLLEITGTLGRFDVVR